MYVKCSQCKTRHRVTDENVRADGSSIKCRDCDTVVYFKNPPPIRVETEEISKPVSMHIEEEKRKEKKEYSKPESVPAKKVLKEEKRKLTQPVGSPARRDTGKEHKDTAVKVPLPENIKKKTNSQLHSLFEQIMEKMESKGYDSLYSKLSKSPKEIRGPEVSYRTVLIVIVVCIILFGFIINVLSE